MIASAPSCGTPRSTSRPTSRSPAGRGAPHAEHPPVPRAALVHREPRRRPRDHRRRRPGCRSLAQARRRARHGRVLRGRGRRRRRPRSKTQRATRQVLRYDELLAAPSQPRSTYPEIDERAGRGDVLHERHHRQPEGCRLLAPLHVPALDRHRRPGRGRALHATRPRAADRADVPRQRVGHALRGVDGGRRPAHARAGYLQAEPLAAFIAEERPTSTCAVPTIWADLLRYAEQHEVDFSSLRADHVRRRGRAALADGGVPGSLRRSACCRRGA